MALPALMPEGARIAIQAQTTDPDGRGLQRRLHRADPGRSPAASPRRRAAFASPDGRASRDDLTSLTLDGEPVSEARLYFLVRYLAGDAGRPRRRSRAARRRERASPPAPHAVAYGLQMALDGLAARVDLRAARGRLFADLRPHRPDQFRLRRNRRGRRLCGGDRGARHGRLAAGAASDRGLRARRPRSPPAGDSPRRARCSFRCARPGASRSWWRPSAWRCSCASSCASRRATGRAG